MSDNSEGWIASEAMCRYNSKKLSVYINIQRLGNAFKFCDNITSNIEIICSLSFDKLAFAFYNIYLITYKTIIQLELEIHIGLCSTILFCIGRLK